VFVTPPICDAARHACAVWVRNLPHVNCQVLYLPQNAARRTRRRTCGANTGGSPP